MTQWTRTSSGRRGGIARIAAAVCGAAALAAGCAPYATYPPVEGTVEIAKPTFEPIPSLIAASIEHTRTRFDDETELRINLPEGTSPTVYEQVIAKLGEGEAMDAPGERAYHVERVRVRGRRAEVDLVYPRRDDRYERVTIYFRHRLPDGYFVKHSRLWRVPVEAPGPPATHVRAAGGAAPAP